MAQAETAIATTSVAVGSARVSGTRRAAGRDSLRIGAARSTTSLMVTDGDRRSSTSAEGVEDIRKGQASPTGRATGRRHSLMPSLAPPLLRQLIGVTVV